MTSPTPSPNRWLIRLQQFASVLFFIYVLVLLGRSAWASSQSNRKLTDLRTTIQSLEADNSRLENLQSYLQTNSFRELEARQDLKIKRPGEIVIALPDEPNVVTATTASSGNSPQRPTTVVLLEAWYYYFFR